MSILTILALVLTEVIGRKFFNFSIVGTIEIVSALVVVAVFLALPYTESRNEHVKVEFVVQHLGRKTQLALEASIVLVTLVLFSVMIWQSMVYALDAWGVGLRYETARLPIFPIRLMIPVGVFFFSLQLLPRLVSSIAGLLPTRSQLSDS